MSKSLLDKFNKFDQFYLMEQHRIDSFKHWPHDATTNCSIRKMAEAGFYWSGSSKEEDSVTCFVCSKTLLGWDPTDDPWKEHSNHAPQCQFVKFGHKEEDLTTEEFLKILSAAGRSFMEKQFKKIKENFQKSAESELNNFLAEK